MALLPTRYPRKETIMKSFIYSDMKIEIFKIDGKIVSFGLWRNDQILIRINFSSGYGWTLYNLKCFKDECMKDIELRRISTYYYYSDFEKEMVKKAADKFFRYVCHMIYEKKCKTWSKVVLKCI